MQISLHCGVGVRGILLLAFTGLAACENQASDVAPECVPYAGSSLVRVPPGTYALGNSSSLRNYETNRLTESSRPPLISVNLQYSYFIQNTEVTSDSFLQLMGYDPTPRVTLIELVAGPPSYPIEPFNGSVPAHRVSWFEALDYANALSEHEGLEPCYDLSSCTGSGADGTRWCDAAPGWELDCEGYRLPTAVEWEVAARAGTEWDYTWTPFDSGYGEPQTYAAVLSLTIPSGFSGARPLPVGSLCPNDWQLYDMQGNVAEWVIDGPYNASESIESFVFMRPNDGAQSDWWPGDSEFRETRGGHISSGQLPAALGVRRPLFPVDNDFINFHHQGFRLVRFDEWAE